MGISLTARLSLILLPPGRPSSACCPVPSGSVRNSVIVNSLQCSRRDSFNPICSSSLQLIPYRVRPSLSPGLYLLFFPPTEAASAFLCLLLPASHSSMPTPYLLDLLLEAPALFASRVCLSSRRVTQIQNQLMTSTKAKAKKTLFLRPSPPQVLAA